MTPPPLRPHQQTNEVESSSPPPISPASESLGRQSRRSGIKWITYSLIAAVLIAIIIVGALAATCPNERQMRDAVYGELGPEYKRALEWLGAASKLFNGPHMVYRNHVIYSTLDFDKGGGNEIRLASGSAGNVEVTSNVKEVKDFILSVPGVRKFLSKKQS